ncbi:MAG: lipocalin family protein, partial [Crocinitomicaceae bacterium]|nr:lipocalin family protein [Crocinitomicaceae bacterium]
MKRIIATICLLFIAAVSFSQNDYLLGTWKFEKIADDQNLDDQSLKLANEMFANMTITFEAKFYSQSFMGKTETGTYSFLKKNKYEFFSSKGYNYKVEIEKIDDTHMTFRFSGKAYQMKKKEEEKP